MRGMGICALLNVCSGRAFGADAAEAGRCSSVVAYVDRVSDRRWPVRVHRSVSCSDRRLRVTLPSLHALAR